MTPGSPPERSAADLVAEHMAECTDAKAAIVVDGSADEVITQLIAAGWTLRSRVDYVLGKRIRFLSAPGAAAEAAGQQEDETSDDEGGRPLEVIFAPGCRVRFAHPGAGYPADQQQAAEDLAPGAVYTIAWSDIGFSSSRIGLAGIQGSGLGFNSVLFEPAPDDEDAAPGAAGKEQR